MIRRTIFAGKKNAPELQVLLNEILKEHSAEAAYQAKERLLSWQFHTMEFDVHSVDENEVVNPQPHSETGPKRDGFIIRISPIYMGAGSRPSTKGAYSRSKHKYWQHFHMSYEGERVNPAPFRLDILYGKKPDKKLLDAIADAFDQRYRPVSRF